MPALTNPLARHGTASDSPAIGQLPNVGAWKEAGPKPYHADDPTYGLDIEGFDVIAGRTAALAIDPTTPDIVWAGTAGGGVWESLDAGTHWVPRSDTLPSLAV